MADVYDLVVRNGLIVDGSGGEPFRGDVAVRDGVIAAVGKVDGKGREEIDAKGQVVTPGFVDVHTHYDGQAIWSDRIAPSSGHGVTTVVMGNCGVGFAPCRPADHELLIKVMEGVEDIPGVVMADGLDWSWETFPQYLDAVASRVRDIDVAAFLPHSPLRVYVMGERGANREPATPEDLAKMRRLAREAIEAGAMGFATSRIEVHRTADGDLIPSYDAAFDEIEEIAAGMTDAGGGTLQVVPDSTDGWRKGLSPFIEIGRRTGRPITFTLAVINDPAMRPQVKWEDAKDLLEQASTTGVGITAQLFPRPIGMIMGLEVTVHPFSLCPTYLAMKDLPLAERVAKMRDPAVRAALMSETMLPGHPLARQARNFEWMFPMLDSPNYEPSPETSIASQARAKGVKPEELVYDMLLEKEGKALLWLAMANFPHASLDKIGEILDHENVIVGLGDGGAHYSMVCDSSYPTFLLAHWSRDRNGVRIPLPRAVEMLSTRTAEAVGLLDRGRIATGYKADLNVIDLDQLSLHSPEIVHDLPGGGKRLTQRASGFVATIVSGEVIARDGQPTSARPGRLVRGQRKAPSPTRDAMAAVV